MTNEKKIPVWGTIYSNQLPQLSMQMSTNANTNVECNGRLTKYKHIFVVPSNVPLFFLADSQHIYCPFVQFSTFNFFFGRFSTHLSPSFSWSLLVLVGAAHHLTQTSTSIFANSSLGLIPHSLSVTSSHLRLPFWAQFMSQLKRTVPDLDLSASLPSDCGVGFLSEWISLCVSQKLSPLHTQQGHLCLQHTWHTLLRA